MKRSALVSFCVVSFLVFASVCAAGVTMEVLPLLPGDDRAEVTAINARGDVVGYSYNALDANAPRHAFLWTRDGGLRELVGLGGTLTEALDINDAAQVVGRGQDFGGAMHALLWSPDGTMTDIGPVYLNSSSASRINNAGQVIGGVSHYLRGFPPINITSAFFWSEPTGAVLINNPACFLENLVPTGCSYTAVNDINESGEVVGFIGAVETTRHAMRWGLATGMEDLGPLTGVPSAANGLNDAGLVAGEGNGGVAFLLSGTSVEWIGAGQPTPNLAFDVNNSSQAYGAVYAVEGKERGFFWSPVSGYADIGTLGGRYSYVYDFNNAGLISGLSEYSNNKYHAMAWSQELGMVDLSPKVYGAATASNDAGLVGGWIRQVVRKITKYPPVLWTITP